MSLWEKKLFNYKPSDIFSVFEIFQKKIPTNIIKKKQNKEVENLVFSVSRVDETACKFV